MYIEGIELIDIALENDKKTFVSVDSSNENHDRVCVIINNQ